MRYLATIVFWLFLITAPIAVFFAIFEPVFSRPGEGDPTFVEIVYCRIEGKFPHHQATTTVRIKTRIIFGAFDAAQIEATAGYSTRILHQRTGLYDWFMVELHHRATDEIVATANCPPAGNFAGIFGL